MSGRVRLRPVSADDHDWLLALNEDHVAVLSPLDLQRLAGMVTLGARAEVLDVDGERGGFVVTVPPGTAYDSENYRWFTDGYGEDFLYLDRVVVDPAFRRRGLADAAYDELEGRAAATWSRLALEVNAVPPNEASLSFHARRGYEPVGEREEPGGKRVRMLAKPVAWHEAVRRMWAEDHASRGLGMELEAVWPGHAVVRMPVRQDMVNGHAIGHGGLTFTLADTAFAFACNSHGPVTVAHGATVRFTAPVRLGDVLVARASERSLDGRRGVYDVEVRSGEQVVAVFEGRSTTLREQPGT
jgi:phenylacetic acid degradation protein PaaD